MRLKIKILPAIGILAALGLTGALAQQPPMPQGGTHEGMMGGKMSEMGDSGGQMMAMHEQMMADMKAGDARLDGKIDAMNAARGNAKTLAMAAVINEMATQHKQMMAKMATMHSQMMEHMMHPDSPMKGMQDMGKGPMTAPK